MNTGTLLFLLALSTMAGLAILLGAGIAALVERKGMPDRPVLNHTVLSFGGGALMSAVGLVLAPDALDILPPWIAVGLFLLGGVVFMLVDKVLHNSGTPVSNVVATLLDFVPEAIVLGAVIVAEPRMAVALAVLIAAQNLPEGFAAYRQIAGSGSEGVISKHPLGVLSLCVVIGPLAAMFGYYVCGSTDPLLGSIMSVCAGGILFIVFRDIAPAARYAESNLPTLGAVAGFAVGLLGVGLTH